MYVNPEVVRDHDRTFRQTIFNQFRDMGRWKKFVKVYNTNGKLQVTFDWSEGVGGVNEWKGERQIDQYGIGTFTINSKPWEKTLSFNIDNFNDPDQKFTHSSDMQGVAMAFARHLPGRFFTKLLDTTLVGPDGVTFFNAAHPIPGDASNTNSNIVSGSGLDEEDIIADFMAAKALIRSWVVRGGDPMFEDIDFLKFTVMAPSEYEEQFSAVFTKERMSTNTAADLPEGFLYQEADLWTTARLDGTDDWIVLIEGMGVTPMLLMQVKAMQSRWHRGGDLEFMKNIIMFGADAHYDVNPWHWEAAILIQN